MTIYRFLHDYYGIELNYNIKFSHRNIKESFPHVKRTSCDYAKKNPDEVAIGKIIYVEDSYGEKLPYVVPNENKVTSYSSSNIDVSSLNRKKNNYLRMNANDDISKVPTNILRSLLNKYKNNYCIHKKIYMELRKRGFYSNKRYKLAKENDKNNIEESELNDKYKGKRRIKHYKP